MGLAIGGVIANWFAIMIIFVNGLQDRAYQSLLPFAIIFAVISLVGLIIAISGNNKVGGVLIIIGSILFVPLGLIGVFGGKKVMNLSTDTDLDSRRKKIENHDEN